VLREKEQVKEEPQQEIGCCDEPDTPKLLYLRTGEYRCLPEKTRSYVRFYRHLIRTRGAESI
jgi:hypothetical protein